MSNVTSQEQQDAKQRKKVYDAQRYKNNKEKINAASLQWQRNNSERVKQTAKRWQESNAEKVRSYSIKWYDSHTEQADAASAEWAKNNTEQKQTTNKQWRASNPERVKIYAAMYRRNNPEKITKLVSNRKFILERCTPIWAELDRIREVYLKRDEYRKRYGIKFEVDHIIPLNSNSVCGLHVWANLQLLDETLNQGKSNNYQTNW